MVSHLIRLKGVYDTIVGVYMRQEGHRDWKDGNIYFDADHYKNSMKVIDEFFDEQDEESLMRADHSVEFTQWYS